MSEEKRNGKSWFIPKRKDFFDRIDGKEDQRKRADRTVVKLPPNYDKNKSQKEFDDEER